LIFSASIVFSFLFVKDDVVESFVSENEIDDAEVLREITIKRTIAVCKVLTDDFFIISSYIIELLILYGFANRN
jgi:riboflavin synthase